VGNLQEGDKIAITNLMMLKDGMPVKVINWRWKKWKNS
jgi:hypothetical protein